MRYVTAIFALALVLTGLVSPAGADGSAVGEEGEYLQRPVPPQPNWDGIDVRERLAPPAEDGAWFGGFGADNNLPPIVDFETTMGPTEAQLADEILAYINTERSARGLHTLTNAAGIGGDATGMANMAVALAHRNAAIDATFHSDEITSDTFEYFLPNTWDQPNALPRWAGENVGGHSGTSGSSSDAVRDYLASDPHRTSLMGGTFDGLAIGVACHARYTGGGVSGVMRTVLIPVQLNEMPGPLDEGFLGPYPQGNPAPSGTVIPADEGSICFDLEPGQNMLGFADTDSYHVGAGAGEGGNTSDPEVDTDANCRGNFNTEFVLTNAADASVYRLYCAYFLRLPDSSGFDYWADRNRSGAGLHWISDFFAESDEFDAMYGELTDAEFVDLIYANIMQRNPDLEGYAYWLNRVETGNLTRGEVLLYFSDSPEFRQKTGTN